MKNRETNKLKIALNAADLIFAAGVLTYTIYTLVPKSEKFKGVDAEKLVQSVNNRKKHEI